jgi:glycosyltransferase involved in cell wall biosynthesis
MKTLLLAPELFRSEGGISRILRLYLRALGHISGPTRGTGYVALNDLPGPDPRAAELAPRGLACAVGCDRGKVAFAQAVWREGWDADLIVCGHLHQLPVAWLLSLARPGLRYVLVAHGIEVWRPYSWIERRSLRGAARILCISEFTRRQVLRFDPGLDPARLVVVPNSFDPGFETAGTAPETAARSAGGPVILTVARLTKADTYKGVDTVIEAMPRVLRVLPQARLRVVGEGDDLPRLRALAQRTGVAGAVHFTGFVDDATLRGEYRRCDLFALPSRKEGFGLVYLEALGGGKPCIAARAGGSPEVVDHEVGALVDYGNSEQLADAVIELCKQPPPVERLRARAGHFSFGRFQERLSAALSAFLS